MIQNQVKNSKIQAKVSQGPKRTQKQNNQSHIESQKDQNQFEFLKASQTPLGNTRIKDPSRIGLI